MELFKNALAIAFINFKRWFKDIRVQFIFVCIFVLLASSLSPYRSYGMENGKSCSAWLLPALFRSGDISVGLLKTLLYMGMVLLLCDAPFLSPVSPYMILRSHRGGWWLGEVFYIIGAAFLYTFFITAVSIVLILPIAVFGNEWGDILNEMVFGNEMTSGIEIMIKNRFVCYPSKDVIRYLYPIGSQLYTFFAVWLSFSFLGLLIYLVSLWKKNILFGISAASVFVFLDPLLSWLSSGTIKSRIQIFSPVCWTSIDQLQSVNRFYFMSIPLAIILYFLLIGLLIGMIGWFSKRVMIDNRKG